MNPVTDEEFQKTKTETSPAILVRRFLELLAEGDMDAAVDLLDADVEYINVSMPAIRGRERVRRIFKSATRLKNTGFEVYFHHISHEGDTVLTERTDVLIWGPIRVQIWVCGRFDVRDGRIVLWKDYFDWLNFSIALVRGLVATVIPSVRAKPPAAT